MTKKERSQKEEALSKSKLINKKPETELPAKVDKKPHGNSVEFKWDVLEVMLPFDPSCKYCAYKMGISVDTIEKYIRLKHDMTFLEYKSLFLEDSAWLAKRAAIAKAHAGNIDAVKYVLDNISNWRQKQELSVEDVSDRDLVEAVRAIANKQPKNE